ncbi:reverse transcriptase domain-containing protein, partial [Tanacetum coccineum]
DVEQEPNLPLQEIIILDPDDQPMWESAKTVAPTPNSAIVQLDVDDNFVINSTHLNMIRETKFDGYLRADPHDHICEFLAICNMFRYGKTQGETIKLLLFPFSLCDEAKTWFNELNKESITSWEQMRKAFINRFFPPSLFNRLLLEIRNFSQLVCESLTDAWLRLKIMLRKCHGHGLTKEAIIQIFNHGLDESTQAILDAMDFQIISLNEELQDIRNKYNELKEGNTSKNHLYDDTPMCERHEANYIQSEDFKRRIRSMRTVHWKLYDSDDSKTTGVLPNKKSKPINQEPQSKTDFEKFMTKFLDGQRVTNMFFKNNVNDMILKMKQNEKNFQTKIKNMERKTDEWEKSQNVFSKQTDRTNPPPPPPQAQTEHVNAIFTGSGKSDDSSKIQKDPPPSIIVNNKIKKDKPIKTSKRCYHVVKTKEYPYRKYISKIPYPQALRVDHSHLNRIIKES